MEQRQLKVDTSVRYDLPYLLAEPDQVAEPWPVVLFLHGAGERGDDLDLVTFHGPPMQARAGQQLPFLLVAPQCPEDSWWNWQTEALIALLDEIKANHPVDPGRIYLTGLSMGGMGVWELAARYPDRFAALIPICGIGGPWFASRLAEIPVWAFHNEDDQAVPVSGTTEVVEAIKAAGGNARMTIKPTGGHDSWTAAYDDPQLYAWMLEQHR
jgi:predicted peptidase